MADRQTKVILSATAKEYVREFEKAAKATRDLGSETDKLSKQRDAFQQLGRGAVLAGAAITAATALSVKAAIDWESAWTGVTKTVDGSTQEMAALEDELRSLTAVLPATHEEIAGVAEAAGQLGVQRENIAAFTKTMVDLAETTNLTADEAATSIAQLMNVMQTAPEDVDNLGAALVALGNDGASTERDIVQMAQRIAGAGKIVGLSEAEVLGFANALASVGIEAEAGGTAISRIMTDIAISVSQGGDELAAFAEVAGLSSEQFQQAFNQDPANAIATFIEGLARIDAAGGDVFKTLDDLGQSDIRVSQALLGMANSGDLLRKSLNLGAEAWDDNLALIEEARKRYATTEAQLQMMTNSVNDAAIDLGTVFLPAVKSAADAIGGLAQMFSGLPEPAQGLIGIMGGVAGVVALTGGAALLAVPKIAEFRVALATLGTTAGRLAFIGGGVTIAITALVAVVGSLAAAQAEASAKAEDYAGALNSGADAARDLAIQNLAVEKSLVGLNFGSAFDNAEKLGVSLETVTEAASGNAKALKELNEVLDVATGGGSAAQEMADDLGISMLDLAQSAGTLRDAVQAETDGLARGKEIREQTKEATDENTESTKSAAEAYLDAAGGAEELTSELQKLLSKINEANGVGQDAVSTNARYKTALAGIAGEVERQREEFEKTNGTLDGFNLSLDQNTVAGAENAAMLSDVAGAAQDAAKAQYDVDVTTMSAKEATDKYAQTLADQRKAFEDSATAAGFNKDEVKALGDQVFALPTEKEIKILADTAQAAGALAQLVRTYDGKEITLKLTTDQVAVNGRVYGGLRDGKAAGGPIVGPGSGTSDDVPIMASNGEHMWTAAETAAAGGHAAVEQMRRWVASGQGFSFGGGGGGGSSTVINQEIYAAAGMSPEQVGRASAEQTAFLLREG